MAAIPEEYMHPDMMAIGDSLYQGVRSLTIKRGMCQLSAPALVAEGLGIRHKFSCPDPKHPILIDMERWLRKFPNFGAIKDDLKTNTDYWFGKPASPSGRLLFENASVASATIKDLYVDSWRTADDYLKSLPSDAKKRIKKLDIGDLNLGKIVQALNTRFTLNPSGRASLRDLSQVDLVALRQPKRLLVNIGSNNGLWDIAFEANPNGKVVFKTELKQLAKRLSELPSRVEHIYFNNLALPRTVPNLMPLPDTVEWNEDKKPGADKYYAHYENRFGFGYGRMTGAQLKKLDGHIAKVNEDARAILEAAFDGQARLHFVDLEELLLSYDSKHQRRTANNVIKLKNRKTITNVMVNASPFGNFRRGGTMGLDGMHPTVVGYGLMAQEVLDTIGQAEPDVRRSKVDLDDAFARDKLLTDMPSAWSYGLWLWRDIRRARDQEGFEPEKDEDEEAFAQVMEAACQTIRTA